MGFQQYWGVEFHTNDLTPEASHGTGLKSVVMWEPVSGVKFANNEPARPHFRSSQINVFSEDHRGPGVQHVALEVSDIVRAVGRLRERGAEFMTTPGTYYDLLPQRLNDLGIGEIEEDIEVLRDLGILVDGDQAGEYMLQIFLQELSQLHSDPEAGPFFFEVIQRKGDQGFGAGNFRALFESIEQEQVRAGRI